MPTEKHCDGVDDYLEAIIRRIIEAVWKQDGRSDSATVLLMLLVREVNTWKTIRFLMRQAAKEFAESVTIDVGTLLRAMFDAYLQGHYVIHDPSQQQARAELCLNYEHVERFNRVNRTLRHDNPMTDRLKTSPLRSEGDARNQEAYDRVKGDYLMPNGRIRHTWYPGDLYRLADDAGKADEYDTFVSSLHGCVHSSVFTLRYGPPTPNNVTTLLASTLCARVGLLMADQVSLDLGEDRIVLEEFSKKLWDDS
jgi:hypothetical protein